MASVTRSMKCAACGVAVLATLFIPGWASTFVRGEQQGERAAQEQDLVEKTPAWPIFDVPQDWKQMSPDAPVWIDPKEKRVVLDGEIVLREGYLEMFACLRRTKEHESIAAFPTKAYVVHAALLALGAKPGTPVRFRPQYQAASGTQIEIRVEWRDEGGKQREAKAQDWILDLSTQRPMTHPFVFGGSGFWKDEETGKEHYMAESGDFVCVANFPSAMIDLPIESSQSNEALNFRAITEKIPPEGTPVRMFLKPVLDKADSRSARGRSGGSPPGSSAGMKDPPPLRPTP